MIADPSAPSLQTLLAAGEALAAEPANLTTDITVIIPAYNVGRYISATLASLAAQTYAGWRCLVIDDGSSDNTAALTSAFPDPRVHLIRQANQGVSAARNRGLGEAVTPFVMFLDGDDLLNPTALARLRTGLASAPGAVAAFGALRKILADGSAYPGEKPLEAARYPSGDVVAQMVRENFLANGGQVLARTEIVRRIGGFDTGLRLSEDWEFWCRLALQGPFEYIGAPPEIFSLRMSPGSASGGLAPVWANHQAAVRAVLGNTQLQERFASNVWRKLTRQVWSSHRWEAGRVNFTLKRFGLAYRLMIVALWEDPRPKRLALFGFAIASQITNRSLISRLRFQADDRRRIGLPP